MPEPELSETPGDVAAGPAKTEELAAKAQTYLTNWQRAEADFANFRKRNDQERQDAVTYANTSLVSALLPVLDDMERAFKSLDPSIAGVTLDGLKLVHRKLLATLEAQGLTAIPTESERFNPSLHEAIMHDEGEEGHILAELQKGYRYKGRVLRPALVKVGDGRKNQVS